MNWSDEFKEQCVLRMSENLPRIKKCIDLLNKEQIWQRPNIKSNSIGHLILHLCGNINQYINASLAGKKDSRKRSLEFTSTEKLDSNILFRKIEDTVLQANQTILNSSEQELLRKRKVQGFTLSGMGIVIHVVEHFSYHTGQIAFYTKQLENKDLHFYGDLDLDVLNA